MAKRTTIMIEIDSLLMLRGRSSRRAWCPTCAAEGEVIALETAAVTLNISRFVFEGWLRSGELHRSQAADGSELICLNSLLTRVQSTQASETPRLALAKHTKGGTMRGKLLISTWAACLTALATSAQLSAQTQAAPATQNPHYALIDLQTFPNGGFNQATFLSNAGLAIGIGSTSDNMQHAVLWPLGFIVDISAPGLGGPNSGAFGINEWGRVDGVAESSDPDPNNENFCAYFTGLKCLPFVWQQGVMKALPLLGGNNGAVGPINRYGEISGYAETGKRDPDCRPGVTPTGTGPQVLDYEAVVWGPNPGQMRRLRPLPGDTVSVALWINDVGQAVGVSGTCANTVVPPFAAGPHAVLWERDGSVHELRSLGGTVDPSLLAVGNVGLAINNLGQVVGASALKGNTINHAFLWTRGRGTQDLGTIQDDATSGAQGINDRGEIVGSSGASVMNSRAFVWKDGVMTDLNTLVPSDAPLYLLDADAINERGEIAGFGATSTGELHAFLAIPCDKAHASASYCRNIEHSAFGEREGDQRPKVDSSEVLKFRLRAERR